MHCTLNKDSMASATSEDKETSAVPELKSLMVRDKALSRFHCNLSLSLSITCFITNSSHIKRDSKRPSSHSYPFLVLSLTHRLTSRRAIISSLLSKLARGCPSKMGCGLSKPSHQSYSDLHSQRRPRHRPPRDRTSEEQGRRAQNPQRRRMQRSENSNNMDGSRQGKKGMRAQDQSDGRCRKSREELHREEIHRLGEEYMQSFWDDARRVQDRVTAQRKKRFRLS